MLFLNKKTNLKKIFSLSFLLFFFPKVLIANSLFYNPNMSNTTIQPQTDKDIKQLKKIVKKNDNYKNMIFYYAHSNDPKDWFALGVVYLFGINAPDKNGNVIKPDIKKAEYWLLKATKGNFYTAGITLASVYMYNPKYSNEKNLKKAENILKYLVDKGYYKAITFLADCYKLQGKYDNFIATLTMGDQYNDSNAQLALALLYYYGFSAKEKNGKSFILNRDIKIANYYLTKACTNPNKSKSVQIFCNPKYNKNIVYDKKP